MVHGRGHKNWLDVLGLRCRHLEFGGALDDFLVGSHGENTRGGELFLSCGKPAESWR